MMQIQQPSHSIQFGLLKGSGLFSLMVAMTIGWSGLHPARVRAEKPETAPPQIKTTLQEIDRAASNENLQTILQYYSGNFTSSDGLNRETLSQVLSQFWKNASKLNYRTELKSWRNQGKGIEIETVTQITGTQQVNSRDMTLKTTLRARQYLEGQKIVRQEILSEQSQLTSGSKPPVVEVNLPEQVKVGESFNFDAIVKEPIGNSILMGAALEESVKANRYLSPTGIDLEVLNAGGIFKVGRAPEKPEHRWISAVLLRENGMTIITHRLRVVAQDSK